MKLKVRSLKLESGRPIAFITQELADRLSVEDGGRIEIQHLGKKLTLAVNILGKFLKKGEISLSKEASDYLKTKQGSTIKITPASSPKSTNFILKKLEGKKLTREEIFEIIKDIVNNALNEAEIAYFVSGVFHNGMTIKETAYLTEAMAKTGKIISWKKEIVADKHCIGGIPGNRTTPIVVSICAAAGITIPKTSSRAITTSSATADTLETITNIQLTPKKLKEIVNKTNACLAWGGSLGFAPADDKLIRVEKLLAIDPTSQLIASILSKKISVGSKYVLIDIPYGENAKVTKQKAKELRRKFKKIAKYFKLKIKILLTKANQPIGNGVGPLLEILDVISVLERKNPPKDLEKKAICLSGKILEITNKTKNGEKLAKEILDSKKALHKFQEIIKKQGIKKIPELGKFKKEIYTNKKQITKINNKKINNLGRILGCPNSPGAGIYFHKKIGDKINKREPMITLFSETKKKLQEGVEYYDKQKPIKLE